MNTNHISSAHSLAHSYTYIQVTHIAYLLLHTNIPIYINIHTYVIYIGVKMSMKMWLSLLGIRIRAIVAVIICYPHTR
jgi:hypothetical protein